MLTLTRTPRGSIVTARNDAINPSMESGITGYSSNGYGTGGAGALTQLNAPWAASGYYVAQMKWTTASSNPNGAGFKAKTIYWLAGQTKAVSGSMVCSKLGNGAFRLYLYFLNNAGTVVGQEQVDGDSTGQWTRLAKKVTAPVGTTTVDVYFVLTGTFPMAVNDTLHLDAVAYNPLSSIDDPIPDYFDGSLPDSGETTYQWENTPGASSSLRLAPDPNSILHPAMILGWNQKRPSRNVVHPLLGSPDPVVTRFESTLRRGTMKLLFNDYGSALSADYELAHAGSWTFVDTDLPFTNLSFVVDGEVNVYNSDSRRKWFVEIPFQEVH